MNFLTIDESKTSINQIEYCQLKDNFKTFMLKLFLLQINTYSPELSRP